MRTEFTARFKVVFFDAGGSFFGIISVLVVAARGFHRFQYC